MRRQDASVGLLDSFMFESSRQKHIHFFLVCLALICLALLFVGGPQAYSSRTFYHAWGLGHLLSFALWTWLYLQWRKQHPFGRSVGAALLLAVLLGAGTELLQSAIGREASWQDFAHDFLGCLLVLVFAGEWQDRLAVWQVWLLRAGVAGLVVWAVLPFFKVALDDLVAQQQFPLLAGFETGLEASRWGGDCVRRLDRQYVYSGSASLRVDLTTNRYSGVGLRHFPGDWSGYRALRFHVYNPRVEPFPYYFRVHDQAHRDNDERYTDRYNAALIAQPGWNEVEIPLGKVAQAPRGRTLDLTRIAGMILFVDKLERPQTIYLDEVQLVR